MTRLLENSIEENAAQLEANGFVMLKGLFSSSEAQQAHQELETCYQKDLQARAEQKNKSSHWKGPCGHTVLTHPSHLLIDVYTQSPTLDQMFEKFLTHPETQPLLEKLAGKNIKLRGYNVRRMTGKFDPPPAHEWHRDSLGEFGFGILLTDIAPDTNAATSFVPGSHLFPYCPRWNNLFYIPETVLPWLTRFSFFNKRLSRQVLQGHTGAYGKKGDAYIFINDTWHGRQPNLHGQETMVVLIGAFPTDYEFPDQVIPPPADILNQLPPAVRGIASTQLPRNEYADTILRRTIANRKKTGMATLWRAAQIERKIINVLSLPYAFFNRIYLATKYRLSKI